MNYEKLKTELAIPAYAELTDQEACDLINAKTIQSFKKVDYSDVIAYLTYAQRIVGIVESITAPAVELRYLATKLNSFDLNSDLTKASVNRLLDALISYSLVTDVDKQVILNMATAEPISRAQQLGFGNVRLGDIEEARRIS